MRCILFDESDTLTITEAMLRVCGRILQACPDLTWFRSVLAPSRSASKSASNASLNGLLPGYWRVIQE